METLDTAKHLAELEKKIAILTAIANAKNSISNKISEKFLGKAIPAIIGIEIAVPVSVPYFDIHIPVEKDGDFQARAIHFASRTNDETFGWYFLQEHFWWEYQVSNSGRQRQNQKIPSWVSLMDGTDFNLQVSNYDGCGSFNFAVEDIFPATSTVTVRITPETVDGDYFWAGFSGAYLLK